MRKLLALIFLLTALVSYSQRYPKSFDPFVAENGKTFKVGDTITFTEPHNFDKEFSTIYNNKSLESRTDALYVTDDPTTGERLIYDRRFKSYPIRYFISHPNGKKIAALKINMLYNFFVDINQAIKYDEIANCNPLYVKSIWTENTPLTDSIAFLQYLAREKGVSKDIAKEYLYLFHRNKYNSIREDEFEFHQNLKETQKKLTDLLEMQDTSKVFIMNFKDEVGNYDFDKEAFPIKWKHNGEQVYTDLWEILTPYDINKDKVKLTDLRIQFNNTNQFSELKLNMEKASQFVKFNKDNSGNVDRDIYMKISFRITGLKDGNKVTKSYYRGEKYLTANIISIDFFAKNKERYIDYYHWWLNRLEK
ncbi:hypothetical protein L21SP5_03792 [Salinivirga cyanobacteriivorans]|uniref:EF-hand domain-containing protein n=1 Tax=Salinivirga cyanobacteriivorans TaxID=1307839 RepID=A0A0S2I558_9BACT|nr:DUF4852 domain-containing protein [Salinivirga cyanobacteriivorans]ALO17386.1 hypothetical protein L21SP5_03792 [Salinivirga cyanobacteriivorans]